MPLELQKTFFRQHLALSSSKKLPVIIHMRESGPPLLEELQQAATNGPLLGVMHSFAGDLELAQACLQLGLYLSFAGMVTLKSQKNCDASQHWSPTIVFL